jgi:hypothetical protein
MGRNRAVRFVVAVLLLITISTWSSPHHARAWPPARISSVSADFFFPDLAWTSADGRIVVMSSEYDYHLHVYDRATRRGWPLDIGQGR